ncbi:YdcF family protein [Nocardia ignorata]|uniref:DUF218 domain-containing protein n=1 Tax=Nocardia ignorata TaxID=145285 RepID=A0A4R6PTD9_NOCIG|nr:YdcF family protein [Nocardia ignorata]TDP42048.1 DUF218 domain-containing protein [Nocardia ignorata]
MAWTKWAIRGVCTALTATGFVCAAAQSVSAEPAVVTVIQDLRRIVAPAVPGTYGGDTAVVILGYGLTPEGTMREELLRRLRTGYVQAVFAPWSPIIVTGGNPQAGRSEADAMASWLEDAGIDPARILREPHADSTIGNADHTAALMSEHNLTSAVLVTSADHVTRARAAFDAAGVTVVGELTPDTAPWPHLPLSIDQFGPMLPAD